MQTDLFRLVYCSRATNPFGYTQLTDLLQTACRRNEQAGLGGMLCYAPPFFFQCLEGPRVEVNRTMTRIYRDDRHTDLVILDARLVPERAFPDWAMQLVEANDLPHGLLHKLLPESAPNDTAARMDAGRLLHFLEHLSREAVDSPARSRELLTIV